MSANLVFFVLVLLLSTELSTCFCPRGCLCTRSRRPLANCAGARLRSVPIMLNPRIRSLNLASNAITNVLLDELSLYSELEELDLSGNGLASIERGAFYRLTKLRVLRLNDNDLTYLHIDMFIGLRNLAVLDLSGNGLNRIATTIFSDLSALRVLNLGSNQISDVSPGSFTGMTELRELYLRGNEIGEVPRIALEVPKKLQILDLSYNAIPFVLNRSFEQLAQLQTLNLKGNMIGFVEEDVFAGLQSLKRLDVSSNGLHHLPTLSFRHLPDLQWLSVSGNPISILPTSGFEGLSRLRFLSINDCPGLESADLNAFSGLYAMETLQLARNPSLSTIHPFAFEQRQRITSANSGNGIQLRYLDLSDNALTRLDAGLVHWELLESLNLAGNPWDCSCATDGGRFWMLDVVEFTSLLEPRWSVSNQSFGEGSRENSGENIPVIPTCTGPSTRSGVPLMDLISDNELLSCDVDYSETTRVLLTIVVLTLSLALVTAFIWLVYHLRNRALQVSAEKFDKFTYEYAGEGGKPSCGNIWCCGPVVSFRMLSRNSDRSSSGSSTRQSAISTNSPASFYSQNRDQFWITNEHQHTLGDPTLPKKSAPVDDRKCYYYTDTMCEGSSTYDKQWSLPPPDFQAPIYQATKSSQKHTNSLAKCLKSVVVVPPCDHSTSCEKRSSFLTNTSDYYSSASITSPYMPLKIGSTANASPRSSNSSGDSTNATSINSSFGPACNLCVNNSFKSDTTRSNNVQRPSMSPCQCGLSRESSFRVVTQYPVPITEL